MRCEVAVREGGGEAAADEVPGAGGEAAQQLGALRPAVGEGTAVMAMRAW